MLVYSCGNRNQQMTVKEINGTISDLVGIIWDSLHFHKPQKIFLVGDFDGSGRQDTVFQHIFSRKYNMELDSIPLPSESEYLDSFIEWCYDQEVELCLTFKKDTLHLGIAFGLYCLINLGDLNADKKDEIALSANYYDYSATNSCSIYTICNGKWTLLKQFSIHESAFDFTSNTIPIFKEIKGFLGKENGKWKYLDYMEYIEDNNSKMKLLELGKCN